MPERRAQPVREAPPYGRPHRPRNGCGFHLNYARHHGRFVCADPGACLPAGASRGSVDYVFIYICLVGCAVCPRARSVEKGRLKTPSHKDSRDAFQKGVSQARETSRGGAQEVGHHFTILQQALFDISCVRRGFQPPFHRCIRIGHAAPRAFFLSRASDSPADTAPGSGGRVARVNEVESHPIPRR